MCIYVYVCDYIRIHIILVHSDTVLSSEGRMMRLEQPGPWRALGTALQSLALTLREMCGH